MTRRQADGIVLISAMVLLGILLFIRFYEHTVWSTIIPCIAVGISGLVLIAYYHEGQRLWYWWCPDQPFNPTVKRWVRYLLQAVTAALA